MFSNQERSAKNIIIDFLYLDLNVCERCIATGDTLQNAVNILAPVFQALNYTARVNKVNITTIELAEEYQFVSSPTIRVNGIDICDEVKESDCKDSVELCGDNVDCRVFVYDGESYEQPPAAMIVDGILRAMYGNMQNPQSTYVLPANLKKYFIGREFTMKNSKNISDCGCGTNCGCNEPVAAKQSTKNLLIEWCHLDVDGETCDRCYDTGENLAAEVKRLNRALNPKGIEVKYIEKKLNENQVAESNGILFNGVPIESILNIEVSQNYCGSCSDLIGKSIYCRTIKFEGNDYEDVPAKAIRQAAYKVLGLSVDAPKSSGCCDGDSDCCGDAKPAKTLTIYDPAMCCSTGICGVGVDPELLRISAALETLKTCDTKINIKRFNLTSAPEEFVKNAEINRLLTSDGVDVLPVIVVDGKIVMTKRYPSNDELEKLLGFTCDCLHGACSVAKDSCGCGEGCC